MCSTSGQFEATLEAHCSPPATLISIRACHATSDDYKPDDEPVETIFAGHPLFRHADIKRILVVKVDHMGDLSASSAKLSCSRLAQTCPAWTHSTHLRRPSSNSCLQKIPRAPARNASMTALR